MSKKKVTKNNKKKTKRKKKRLRIGKKGGEMGR